MHTHLMPEQMPRWSEKFGYGGFIHLDHHRKGWARMMQDSKFFREINENCWDPKVRINEYLEFDTQVQVICTIPVLFSYWAKPKDGLQISEFLNDHIAEIVHKYPKQYVGLGTVPMQDAELAIKELHRIKEMGLVGIQIGSNINNKNLNEDEFFPIFEACSKLGLAVMVHPWNMMGKKHMEQYWLPWLVGMPAETSRAMCSMIFGGVLEKLPGLRLNFVHSGGSFLPTIGRVEHGFNCRPDLVAVDNPINPREYLGKFWVDCITHDPLMLEYILKVQGSKRITLGSDYPFPLGDLEIGKFITEMNLDESVVEDIFCNSTLEWLNLTKEQFL
ncbi:MAG: amidohydrolase [Crocinitomicaceae bacterium]|nr:amidohydrolase [Crocinitomicaceae bacterium]MBT5403383.1 amidohydrolase [Crocinitomicaceae bacterium]MBT6030377.1 amidohydrolase [Crocinitomicaceae bacterium]MBT6515677.1 amidohydrolase [Crocinitomicaceae bacterium]